MDRRATTILLGIFSIAFSLAGCASNRKVTELAELIRSDERVFIAVRAGSGGGRIDMVHPPVKESCRPQRTDCGEQVRWKVVGPIGDWKIQVKEKAGGDLGCFAPFELSKNHREEVQRPAEKCRREETAWFYDVVLTDAGGGELHRVDPLVLVSWTPGS